MIPPLDWLHTYAPAALAVWQGRSPYTVPIFFAAPWATLPLIPFALMPDELGRWCLLISAFGAFAFTAYRLGAKPLPFVFFLLSYPVLADIANGNIEWMAMLGFVLPPQVGLIFVMIKPQVGIGIAIYWLVEAWREGGVTQVAKTFAPVTVLFLLSFALYGFWPLHFQSTLTLAEQIQAKDAIDYNASLWPFGLLLGLPLLIKSIRHRNDRLSMMSGPFLSPYALIATYAAALLGSIDKPWIFFTAWLITWLPVVLRLISG